MTLKAFISDSGLPQEDKDLWLSVLEKLTDEQAEPLEDFIEGKKENLKMFTENLKNKIKAFKAADYEMLDSILKKEIKPNI